MTQEEFRALKEEYWKKWKEKALKLNNYLQTIKDKSNEEKFFGIPESWYEARRWRCPNGHLASWYIKSGIGVDACQKCGGPMRLTFPEDKGEIVF